MHRLFNKKILLVAPMFFGYEKIISSFLEKQGASVFFIPDRPFRSFIGKALIRYLRPLTIRYSNKFYYNEIDRLIDCDIDYFFVIQGESLTPSVVSHFIRRHPRAKKIIYLWDSIKNKSNVVDLFHLFDKVFTFDRHDSIIHSINYRPLFFSGSSRQDCGKQAAIGLSFVGTCHSDRYEIINKVGKAIPSGVNFYCYMFLQSPWVFYFKKIFTNSFRGAAKNEFQFSPLSASQISSLLNSTFALLDIEHPNQNGLTIRTFEAIGSGKKLITTNVNILGEDFYDPCNIHVISRDEVQFPVDFFSTPFNKLNPTILYKYSIDGWVEELLFNS